VSGDGAMEFSVYAGAVNFSSAEIRPERVPQIIAVVLNNDQTEIEWVMPGKCPGLLRHYEVKILCAEMSSSVSNQTGNSGNISFDCRDYNNTNTLAFVPSICQNSSNLTVQVNFCRFQFCLILGRLSMFAPASISRTGNVWNGLQNCVRYARAN
jgi:hypothetical protein